MALARSPVTTSNGTFDASFRHVGTDETITGSFADGKVSLTATRVDGVEYSLTDAPMDSTTITVATRNVNGTADQDEGVGSGHHYRHDDHPWHRVREEPRPVRQGADGGKAAAQACAGMPLNSTQGS